jgi:hypothetical protein
MFPDTTKTNRNRSDILAYLALVRRKAHRISRSHRNSAASNLASGNGLAWRVRCARATRGLRRAGGEPPDHPSCSQNAHDETVLVRCAQ